ncbi:MAG: S8 family serine peptidase [Eubacteriales bacterium]|nr:S8 family serine peptidase [Eubacteriales bacterium]
MDNSFEPGKINSATMAVATDPIEEPDILPVGNEPIEVIVKYTGDISGVSRDLNAEVEILYQGYAIITLDESDISKLYSYQQIISIELPKNLYITAQRNLITTCIRTVQSDRNLGLDGSGVVVAIIDSGIDYTHLDFRNPDGTSRILYIWDQTEVGTPPAGFSAGAEYTQQQINNALRSENPLQIVPSTDTSGHGTAVAGIAAGNGWQSNGENIGVAPKADLIVVKVGSRGFTSFARNTELMRGVKYVIKKARQLNKPLAINMSFGMNNGSHLGDSLFETYLSDMSTEWKNCIIIPTGNEGAAGHHYSDTLKTNTVKEVEFVTIEGLNTFYISMWKNLVDRLSVELIFPNGSSSGVIGIESQIKNVTVGNVRLTVIYGQPTHYSVNQEIFFNIKAITGTVFGGLWKLRIISNIIVEGNIEMWLPTIEEVTDGTQFSNPSIYNTMTIPSTALSVIKVAGYNDQIGNIADFSGVGNSNKALPNPDIAAPAVGIVTVKSGGGYDSFTGTSMAAPFVTGAAALIMQWGIVNRHDPFLYGERVKAFLWLGANRRVTLLYPNPTFGYGTLCLDSTIAFLERYEWGGNNLWLQP